MNEPGIDPNLFAPAPAPADAAGPASKRPWESRGVVFGVLSALAALGSLAGLDIDAAGLTEIVMLLFAAGSALASAWGRWRATRPVQLRRAGD